MTAQPWLLAHTAETPWLIAHAWLLPLIMACSFVVILFIGKRLPEKLRAMIGVLAVGVCFVLACVVASQWVQRVNHPPEGAAMVAAEEACGVGPAAVAEGNIESSPEAVADGSHSPSGSTGSEAPATGEAPASEHGLAPPSEGENAGVALPVQHGEGDATTEAPAPVSEGGTTSEPATTSEHGAAAEAGGEAEHEQVVPVCSSRTWFESGSITFDAGIVVDGLSAMMLFTVTLISLLVHIYSMAYLEGDRRHTHYYAFLSLFTASMLFYVLSNNTLQMLVGWELVGVCSFALIGHWWEEQKNTDAALKAFLTNRVGDMGLIIGVIITFFATGATSFNVFHINEAALSGTVSTSLLFLGGLCLFFGVTSKSGQVPLHTWLPDAMAGPTPVSALIHAATMVVAGVYLIARLYSVYWAGFAIGDSTIHYVAFIGGLTTVVGASMAFVQHDLKKVLAYSTISQLGYMVMALGVGAWTAGVFHLFTHAMFKACLFLCAGSVSHACHHTFDMREMGGLHKKMKTTHWAFILSGLALAGLFPFAGFWSKDEILAGAANGQGAGAYYVMLGMGLLTAFMTACYMGRAYYLTFRGEYRGHAHPHESPKTITIPLIILAFMSLVVGFLNFPFKWFGENTAHRFEHYVQPTFAFPTDLVVASFNPAIAGISLALAAIGGFIGIAYYWKGRPLAGLTDRFAPAKWGYYVLENKYGLDGLYSLWIAGSTKGPIARASYWVNQHVIDGIVNGVGVATRSVGGFVYRYVDQGVVDNVVNGTGSASEESGQFLRRIQTGKIGQYAALLFGGVVVLAIIFVITV